MYWGKQQSTIVVIDDGDSSFEFVFAHSPKLLLDNIYLMQLKYGHLRGGESLRYGP